MSKATLSDNKKKIGRPATGMGQMIGVRLQPDQLAALERWIDTQPDPRPSKPEAIRRLMTKSLENI